MKLKIILIDDEPLAREVLTEYLREYEQVEIVAECNDGFEGLKAINQHKPDLVFLDIQMPKITGFEMLELLDTLPPVIFTTAFDEYAIKAFESNAVDYLLKPFSKERFDKAMKKLNDAAATNNANTVKNVVENLQHPEHENRIVVKSGNNIRIIPAPQVLYLEAYDDYVKVHIADGYHLKKKTMNYFEQSMDPKQFVRVHRSFIVQLNQITKIEQSEKDNHLLILKNGTKIPVSKTGYPKLKTLLGI